MKELLLHYLRMLDLSAAFDVINDPILLKHLEFSFIIKGKGFVNDNNLYLMKRPYWQKPFKCPVQITCNIIIPQILCL